MHGLELVPGPVEDFCFELKLFANLGEVLISLPASRLQLGLLGAFLLEVGEVSFEFLATTSEVELHVLVDRFALADDLGLQRREIGVAALFVDRDNKVGRKVDDLLKLLGLELFLGLGAHEEIGEPGAGAPQVPDMNRRGSQLDVAHALAPDL